MVFHWGKIGLLSMFICGCGVSGGAAVRASRRHIAVHMSHTQECARADWYHSAL